MGKPVVQRKMTPKKLLFCQEYLKDLNATQAAARAGYSAKTVDVQGPRLLEDVGVRAFIQKHMDKRAARVEVSVDRVLTEISRAAFFDPLTIFAANGTILNIHDIPEDARRAIASIECEEIFEGTGKDRKWIGYLRKVKFVSKEGTLQLAGRHLKMFTDTVDLNVQGSLAQRLEAATKRRGGK